MKIHGTAKGGALSTKDFGVAFGNGGEELLYDQQVNGGVIEQNDYPTAMAQEWDNESFANITKVVVYLRKYNSPTMNIKIGLWNTSAIPESPTGESFTVLNTQEVTTSYPSGAFLPYTFDFVAPLTSLSGDNIKIGIITDTPNVSNYVQVAYSTNPLVGRQSVDDYLDPEVWRNQKDQSWLMQVWGG